jgi:hypothetical protein
MKKPTKELTTEQLNAEDLILAEQKYTKTYWALPTQAQRDAYLEVAENYQMVGKEYLWKNRHSDHFWQTTGKLHWQLTANEMRNYYFNHHSNY